MQSAILLIGFLLHVYACFPVQGVRTTLHEADSSELELEVDGTDGASALAATASYDASEVEPGHPMNIRQRVVCDVCLRGVTDCKTYQPSKEMLNGKFPKPENNIGKLWECKPSEREQYSTDRKFKVTRPDTPEWKDCPSERRKPQYDGALDNARRVCKLAAGNSETDCSKLTNAKVPVFKRAVTCSWETLYNSGVPKAQTPKVRAPKMRAPKVRYPKVRAQKVRAPKVNVTSSDSASTAAVVNHPMNMRQRVVCDVCLRGVTDCKTYTLRAKMLNGKFPKPENNIGKMWECKPSEREQYSTDRKFKVTRPDTPEWKDCPSERRKPQYDGKLDVARRVCKLAAGSSETDCSKLTNTKVKVYGRTVTCSEEALELF